MHTNIDPRPIGRRLSAAVLAGLLAVGGVSATGTAAVAVGEGPNPGNGSVQTSILHAHEQLVAELQKQDAAQESLELEVIGQSVKGRDLYLAKYVTDPSKPTILYLTQQHGNEQLTTEGALAFIKSLGNASTKGILDGANVLVVPMLNPDGAMGDVDFSLEDYVADGDRHLTRYNANNVDLNRDHVAKEQPETQALHENVLAKYGVDYMVDLHHQGTQSEVDGEYVSGSILYPTSPSVDPAVVEGSKRLGSVVYGAIQPTGWGSLGKYVGGTANTIGRNGIADQYGISTLLFEMRGMSDHYIDSYALGQKSNGYLIQQTVLTLTATARAVAAGSVETADTSFWDTLPEQTTRGGGEDE